MFNDAYFLCSAVAETTTGCLFAAEVHNECCSITESAVTKTAKEVWGAVVSGSCVDVYLQDQVSGLPAKEILFPRKFC